MQHIKHVGIYVRDLEKEKAFYSSCFGLKVIVDRLEDSGVLYKQLFGCTDEEFPKVFITKMITEHGVETGIGEMIELIQVETGTESLDISRKVQDCGLSHISFSTEDISSLVESVKAAEGKQLTDIIGIGSRKCCFCADPEGNVLELIQ